MVTWKHGRPARDRSAELCGGDVQGGQAAHTEGGAHGPWRPAVLCLPSALLVFAFAACGGDETTTVALPPTPPPAPPPFQPQPIEVALVASGQTITLMTAEAGGFVLSGGPVSSGATHAAANGDYTLTLADGAWTAAFDSLIHEVPLGASGDSITIVQMEACGYLLDGEAIAADTTVVASNGATYGIAPGEVGMPLVMYMPTSVTIMLGEYGGELTLTLADDQGTYMRNGEAFASGTVVLSNDRHYIVTLGEDGWMAEFVKPMPLVQLGHSGSAIRLIQTEDLSWWLDPETPLNHGDTITSGANAYTLTLADGVWTATFAPKSTEVVLGMSGESVIVTQAEAGGYLYNGMRLSDGALAKSTSGATYSLSMDADGAAVATYKAQPTTVRLGDRGGTITLFLQEDQMTWLLARETEPFTSGRVITIESISNTYTVILGEDGIWTAVYNEVEVMVDLGTSGDVVTLIRDETGGWRIDPGMPVHTGGTRTAANGNIYRLTLEDGEWTASYVPATMPIPGTGLTAVRNEDQTAEPGYHVMEDPAQKLDENGLGSVTSPNGNFRVHMNVFGNLVAVRYEEAVDGRNDGKAGYSIGRVSVIGDDAETVPNEAGTKITIGGVNFPADGLLSTVKSAVEGDSVVAKATSSTVTAYLARTENTRFGIHTKPKGAAADAVFGVFAYSPMKAARYADLPTGAGAFYYGRTMAIDSHGKTIYHGDIGLQIRFRAKRVSGLIQNLTDADGQRLEYSFGRVASIILPAATIRNDGSFIKDAERSGQIIFTSEPGSPRPILLEDRRIDDADVAGSSFAGQLVGDGAAAVGTWAISASRDDSENLSGAFGVERGEDVTDLRPEVAGVGTSITSLDGTQGGISAVSATGVITLASGLTVHAVDLLENGRTTINGNGFVAKAIEDIQGELERLNAFIAWDELGDEADADIGRTEVWGALATALDALVGSGNGAQIFSTGDYVTTNDDDTRADSDAKERIARILEALSSETTFRSAVREGGVLYGNSGLVTGDDADINAVFTRVMSTATVEYGTTSYTRFGAWNRVGTTEATTAPSDSGLDPANGVFAYSPLAGTAYGVNDPNFPGRGQRRLRGLDDRPRGRCRQHLLPGRHRDRCHLDGESRRRRERRQHRRLDHRLAERRRRDVHERRQRSGEHPLHGGGHQRGKERGHTRAVLRLGQHRHAVAVRESPHRGHGRQRHVGRHFRRQGPRWTARRDRQLDPGQRQRR